ncbi:hypothetical protein SDC9_197806 [bioreactor metagenome]|uniref:Uncharacterized protein n=1 Tax=bioreactor metagenome TaxID=1076179 RepID=A0A645IGE1_9ZZZZ
MFNGLPGCWFIIVKNINAAGIKLLFQSAGQLPADNNHPLQHSIVGFVDISVVFLRHDQRMAFRYLGNIKNSQDQIVFIDDMGRNFLFDNLAENAHDHTLISSYSCVPKPNFSA